jgi:serine/threonine protein kinase
MTSSSFIYCSVCGAANQAQAFLRFACGHLLETSVEDTALPSPAGPPVSRPLLAGRYRIVALVGEGGFGTVYKAVDMQRDEALVALKQINLSGLRPRDVIEATETFNREVGMLSGLKHPNLPRIYKYFTDAEHWYLAMDFIEGETLEEYLNSAKGGHLPVEEVLEIGI